MKRRKEIRRERQKQKALAKWTRGKVREPEREGWEVWSVCGPSEGATQ